MPCWLGSIEEDNTVSSLFKRKLPGQARCELLVQSFAVKTEGCKPLLIASHRCLAALLLQDAPRSHLEYAEC